MSATGSLWQGRTDNPVAAPAEGAGPSLPSGRPAPLARPARSRARSMPEPPPSGDHNGRLSRQGAPISLHLIDAGHGRSLLLTLSRWRSASLIACIAIHRAAVVSRRRSEGSVLPADLASPSASVRPQPADPSSGRRGREFKSPPPDQCRGGFGAGPESLPHLVVGRSGQSAARARSQAVQGRRSRGHESSTKLGAGTLPRWFSEPVFLVTDRQQRSGVDIHPDVPATSPWWPPVRSALARSS